MHIDAALTELGVHHANMTTQLQRHSGMQYAHLMVRKALGKPQFAKAILHAAWELLAYHARNCAPPIRDIRQWGVGNEQFEGDVRQAESLYLEVIEVYRLITDIVSQVDELVHATAGQRGDITRAAHFHRQLHALYVRRSFAYQRS